MVGAVVECDVFVNSGVVGVFAVSVSGVVVDSAGNAGVDDVVV